MSASALCETPQVLGKRRKNEPHFFSFFHPQVTGVGGCSQIKQTRQLHPPSSSKPGHLVIINGKLQADTRKRYCCTYKGCEKAYSKPSRLAEHERSHTGQRPYQCETCKKSYLRETHLQAHVRSHLPETSRPFVCGNVGCEKRFWTAQHLKVHIGWHEGAKPFACTEAECSESFAKHHQLRSHIAKVHSPPGTKPYQCEQALCNKSFSTNQQLRAHTKTHDEKRYTCVYPRCAGTSDASPVYFPTWSALQNHIRTAHPPTCTFPECGGRTFPAQKGLRAHLKLHEQQDIMEALEANLADNGADQQPAKKRRGGDWGRDWVCDVENCAKDFKSKKALSVHKNVTHLGQRNFVCSYENCQKAYGYKHLLQRHVAKAHCDDDETHSDSCGSSPPSSDEGEEANASIDIGTITGYAYSQAAKAKAAQGLALLCPFPDLHSFTQEPETTNAEVIIPSEAPGCDYAFRRAYDLHRHLKGTHDFIAQKESVELWVAEQKLAWFT